MSTSEAAGYDGGVTAFQVLNIIGLILLIVVLLPALISRKVKRMKTWFGLIISCIIFCLSYIVLLGRQSGAGPPVGLCLFQAALIYAAPAYATLSWMCLLCETFLRASLALKSKEIRPVIVILLVLGPPFVHIMVFVEALLLGQKDLASVKLEPSQMYCHITTGIPTYITTAITIFAILSGMILQGLMATFLYQNWTSLRPFRQDGVVPAVSLSVHIRLFTFFILSIIGLGIALVIGPNPMFGWQESIVWNSLLVTVPILVAMVFGTHKDAMYALCHSCLSRKTQYNSKISDL